MTQHAIQHRLRRFGALFITCIFLLSIGLTHANATDAPQKTFDIPAGPAENTLKTFSKQAGIEVIFATEIVTGTKTSAIQGAFMPLDALGRLLAGTSLVAKTDERTGAIIVSREGGEGINGSSKNDTDGQGVRVQTSSAAQGDATKTVVMLDPFQVTTDKDEGYLANNTLSGTQFNTALADTAASIEVFTPQFIQDVGAFTVRDLLIYGNNTVIDEDEGTGNGNVPSGNGLTLNYSQFRVRGGDISQSRDYFGIPNMPIDMYNIDRVEESRGPNDVLFGVGSPNGDINYATKQATLGRSFGSVDITTGSYNTLRTTLDLNKSFDDNKLAIRFDLLDSQEGTYRYFATAHKKAGTGTITYRLAPKVTLHALVEVGSSQDEGLRNAPLRDQGVEEWIALGRPLFAPNSPSAYTPGDQANGNWGYYGSPGTYQYPWTLDYTTTAGKPSGQLINNGGQLFMSTQDNEVITDPNLANPRINTRGPDNQRESHWITDLVSAEVQWTPSIYSDISYDHFADQLIDWNNGNDDAIQPDADALASNGMLNPHAGQLYLTGNAESYVERSTYDDGRFLTFFSHNFGKWWGNYNGAISFEQDDSGSSNYDNHEVWAGAPFDPTPDNTNNYVYRVNFVTPGQWNTYYVPGPGNSNAFLNNVLDPSTGRRFSSEMAPASADGTLERLRSAMGILQAKYFDDRLVFNAGIRRDELNIKAYGTKRDPVTDFNEIDPSTSTDSTEVGNTSQAGAVLHVVRMKNFGFDLLADKSDNFGLPNGNVELTGAATGIRTQTMPAAQGKGDEFGFAVTLLDGALYLKAVHFEDNTINLYNYVDDDDVGPKNGIIDQALLGAGYISQATYDERDLSAADVNSFDQTDNGYELSLTANLTKNWQLKLNYSINNPNEEDVATRDIDLWNTSELPFYSMFPETVITQFGDSIASEIRKTDEQLAYETSVEGKGLLGFRKYKWNFFTRYTFTHNWLKGAYVGGGFIYQSQMLIGAYPDGSNMYGGSTTTASGLLGYKAKVWGHPVRFQLNILNLFNNTDAVIYRRAIDTGYLLPGETDYLLPLALYYPDPRSWRLDIEFPF